MHGDVPSCRFGKGAGFSRATRISRLFGITFIVGRHWIISCQTHSIRSIGPGIQWSIVVGKHRLLLDGHILVDFAHEERCLLGLVAQHESARLGHRVPVVATPSLNHQQEVEGTVVLLIVLLEEIARVLHEAAYLTGQKHFGQYIAVVVEILGMRGITHRDTDGSTRFPAFNSKADRSKWLCRLRTETSKAERTWCEITLAAEEETVGIDTPHIIKYSDLADACFQFRLVEGKSRRGTRRNCLEVEQYAVVHHSHAERFTGSSTGSSYLHLCLSVLSLHLHGTTVLLRTGQALLHRSFLASISHAVTFAALWSKCEGSTPSLFNVCLCYHSTCAFGHRNLSI